MFPEGEFIPLFQLCKITYLGEHWNNPIDKRIYPIISTHLADGTIYYSTDLMPKSYSKKLKLAYIKFN